MSCNYCWPGNCCGGPNCERESMNFKDYEENALKSAKYPGKGAFMGVCYCGLKLNGEAGEVAEKIGKAWRDYGGEINNERRLQILFECGDVLWYLTMIAREHGST